MSEVVPKINTKFVYLAAGLTGFQLYLATRCGFFGKKNLYMLRENDNVAIYKMDMGLFTHVEYVMFDVRDGDIIVNPYDDTHSSFRYKSLHEFYIRPVTIIKE